MSDKQYNARTDINYLVKTGLALHASAPQEARDYTLRQLRDQMRFSEATMEDQLMEAIWALVLHEDLR